MITSCWIERQNKLSLIRSGISSDEGNGSVEGIKLSSSFFDLFLAFDSSF